MTSFGRGQLGKGGGRRALALVAAVFAVLAAPAADAKVGDGIKMGSGRLRLGVELGARYDSMAITRANEPNGEGDGIGLLRGSFLLDLPGTNFKANVSGGIDWNQFLSLNAPAGNSNGAFSFLGANLLGAANLNPGGQFGLDLTENLSRSDRTSNPLFSVGVLGLNSTTRARLWTKPGGGALEFGAGYELGVEAFSPQISTNDAANYSGTCKNTDVTCNPGLAAAFNSLMNRVGVDAKWRLLPKTGLTLEANYGWKSYIYGSSIAGTVPASPFRAMVGFGTLLSTRTTFNIRAGYGAILFSDATPTRNNLLAQVEGGYRLSETLSARIGYARTDEPIAGELLYYADDRIYADFRGQFNRVVATALASIDMIGYGAGTRTDTNLGLSGTLDYNFTDWMRLTGRLGFSNRTSGGVVGASALGFTRFEMGLGAAALF